jgi:hypothetical protein
VGSGSNPMASFTNMGLDLDLIPRGSFPVNIVEIQHFVAGVYADNSLISTGPTDTWKILLQFSVVEPILMLSPLTNSDNNDCAAFIGINNMQLSFNIDSTCTEYSLLLIIILLV